MATETLSISCVTGRRAFLHVANTSRVRTVRAQLRVSGFKIRGGRIWQVASDPQVEVMETCPQGVCAGPADAAAVESAGCVARGGGGGGTRPDAAATWTSLYLRAV